MHNLFVVIIITYRNMITSVLLLPALEFMFKYYDVWLHVFVPPCLASTSFRSSELFPIQCRWFRESRTVVIHRYRIDGCYTTARLNDVSRWNCGGYIKLSALLSGKLRILMSELCLFFTRNFLIKLECLQYLEKIKPLLRLVFTWVKFTRRLFSYY